MATVPARDDRRAIAAEPVPEVAAVRRRRTILGRPRFAGVIGALMFVWASFWPTLMPRTFVTQGAISGVCAAAGYATFLLLGSIVASISKRAGVVVSAPRRRIAWIALGASATTVLVIGGLWMWVRWQDEQRDLLGMGHLAPVMGVPMLVVAAAVATVLGLIGRLIGRGVVHLHSSVGRVLPPSLAAVVTVVVIWFVGSFLYSDVVVDGFTGWANRSFGTIDDGTADGVEQPTAATVSGSPESLAAWDTLGLQGRSFVATATSTATIAEFQASIGNDDVEVVEPIRAYAGIRTADDVQERADIAVDELERTGAFERSVLVVATATGTGWIDPDSVDALELLHAGDTAVVSIQYSYLPSWIATLLVDDASSEAGVVLFDTVYDRWSELPEADRPELIVYGLSLGSFGAETAFAGGSAHSSVANLTARADGALLVGPTNGNEVWRQITDDREPGSPVWRPVYDGASTVAFANSADELDELEPDPGTLRIQYVQHASDPVTFWSFDTLWSQPEWMDDPRGPDVPDGGPWVPFVTWTQGVFDLMAGFGAPPGHGHDYAPSWPGAWAQVVAPDGWSAADTQALSTFLADRPADGDVTGG
jgi:uncharacterized membrane protein